MSEARVGRISNENSTAGPIISGITTFSGQNYFVPPKGTTAERPSNCPVGSIRFNTDSAKLEYFDGLQWLELEAFNVEIGQAGALGNRGVFGGGVTPGVVNTIDFITISTLGNALDFGDLTQNRNQLGACSSSTRGVFGGGGNPTVPTFSVNTIDYITISSIGNASDFGDLTQARYALGACSSSTRGIFGGGNNLPTIVNTIDFITISSTGNASDFGDLTQARDWICACSSSTRGVFSGGRTPTLVNTIDFITIASTGNAVDFGDKLFAGAYAGGCSSSTRGVFGGGGSPIGNVIEYITIASIGNAQDFGDLTSTVRTLSACSSSTRGLFGGGVTPTIVNTIDYVTILTTGNAQDFGDLTSAMSQLASCSNGHGGL
jgi:hypothetical protein